MYVGGLWLFCRCSGWWSEGHFYEQYLSVTCQSTLTLTLTLWERFIHSLLLTLFFFFFFACFRDCAKTCTSGDWPVVMSQRAAKDTSPPARCWLCPLNSRSDSGYDTGSLKTIQTLNCVNKGIIASSNCGEQCSYQQVSAFKAPGVIL